MSTGQRVIDHKDLGDWLAEGFRTGNSLIENEQRHPPAVGIPTQNILTPEQVSKGTKNYKSLSHADMYDSENVRPAQETIAKAGDSAEEKSSRWLRNQWGMPRMTRDIELTTLEQLVVRGHVNKVESDTGRSIGAMRFGTPKEVLALNLAHGGAYKPSDRQNLRRDPQGNMPTGLTVDLAKRRPKTLYHVDDLRVDSRRARVWTAQNYDEKGNALMEQDANGNPRAARTPPGTLIRTEDGSPRRTNHDASGEPIDDRVGAIQRDSSGEIVSVAVEKLGDREPRGRDWGIEQTELAIRGVPAEGNRRARTGLDQRLAGQCINITTTDKRRVTSSSFSVEDGVPTITLPARFKDKNHELTERARAVAHAEQWANRDNPNYDNARAAAPMKPAQRLQSAEYAACELVAQHAAMAAVTRAGGTYQPQRKAANDKLREHWAKQVSDPAGLDQFGRATDQARRVCDGPPKEQPSNRARDQTDPRSDLSQLMQAKPAGLGQGRPGGLGVGLGPSGKRPDNGAWSTAKPTRTELRRVGNVMSRTSKTPFKDWGRVTTTPDAPLATAARIMSEQKIDCLPVVEGEILVGILKEGDFAGDESHAAAATNRDRVERHLAVGKMEPGAPPWEDRILLHEHGWDVAMVMKSLLECEDIRKCLCRHLDNKVVARLSFMAGLHDAGKVSREFQQDLRVEEKHPVLHCRPLWAVLQPQESWDNLLVGKPGYGEEPVEPQALAACRQIQSLLLSEDRFGWLPSDSLCYWKAILSHHKWDEQPTRDDSREPGRWWLYPWHAEDGYFPCDDLRDLLMGLAGGLTSVGFPSNALIADGRGLPVKPAFLDQFKILVRKADQLASFGISPNVLAPKERERYAWADKVAKSLVKFERTKDLGWNSLLSALQGAYRGG